MEVAGADVEDVRAELDDACQSEDGGEVVD